MNIKRNFFTALALFFIAQNLHAAPVVLADDPLATLLEGAPPNVMLLIDDSRSMTCTPSNFMSSLPTCGDDMFYAPGYDPSKVYACDSSVATLAADSNKFITMRVSRIHGVGEWVKATYWPYAWLWQGVNWRSYDYRGMPYFRYTNGFDYGLIWQGNYGWGRSLPNDRGFSTPEIENPYQNSPRRCFDVNAKYRVYLKAAMETANYYHAPTDPASLPERELSGNFLNWYFSASHAEWKIKDTGGDYAVEDYSTVPGNNGVKHWNQHIARDFIVKNGVGVHYDWDRIWISAFDEESTVFPEKTEINGVTANPTTLKNWFPGFPVEENGKNVNIEFFGTGHSLPEDPWTIVHSHEGQANTANSKSMMGMKPGVTEAQFRLNVAKDVAKIFVEKLEKANIAISSFYSMVEESAGTYKVTASGGTATGYFGNSISAGPLQGPGGTLVHGFVEVSPDEPITSTANRQSLFNAIDMISGGFGTPTAETFVGIARYFFQDWENETLDFVTARDADGTATAVTNKKISEILPLQLKNLADPSYPPIAHLSDKVIDSDNYCRKNYLVALTDGTPYFDWYFDGTSGSTLLQDYDTVGVSGEPVFTTSGAGAKENAAGMVRVAGALYDHDWIPSITGIQNIETILLRMATAPAGTDFQKTGRAGSGGKSANFFFGADGTETLKAINEISEIINKETYPRSITSIALSSVTKLNISNYAFQASYNDEYWDSDLEAFLVDKDGQFIGNGAPQNSSEGVTPLWEAGDILAQMYIYNDADINGLDTTLFNNPGGFNARDIYSWNGSAGVKIIPNTFASLPADIQTDLNATTVGTPANVLKYLLGDLSYEIGNPGASSEIFRQRATYLDVDNDGLIEAITDGGLLGDAIHSSPVYVAEPPRSWDDANFAVPGDKYSQFKKQQADRKPVVYIGTNAGFLHAFAVESGSNPALQPAGRELFSYMPNMLASASAEQGYHYLADPDYEHRYYVDLTATPSDVYMDFYSSAGTAMTPEWRTILVGGLRKGGKGLFALDITCPYQTSSAGNTCDDEKFSQNNVLWEFSAADDADFGYSYGEPIIAKVNVTAGADDRNGAGKGRWAAIVSNGYNPSSSKAVLFIIFLDGGLDGTWSLGTDYLKIDTNVASNGLSSATGVDVNKNGFIDRVYAGDLEGNLWAFNIQNNEVWSFATGHVNKLFTTSAGQPITTPPQVSRNSEHTAAEPNLMVMFGSGQYLNTADLSDKTLQTLYAVHDRGVYNRTTSDLAERSFDSIKVNGLLNRKIIESDTYTAAKYGWYLPLKTDTDEREGFTTYQNDGERIVYRSFLVNNLWVFNSLIPNIEACGSNTSGWTMLIDWTTGLAPDFATYNANGSIPSGGNRGIESGDEGYVGFFNTVSASELGRGGDNTFFGINDVVKKKSVDFGSADINKRLGWEEHFPHSRLH